MLIGFDGSWARDGLGKGDETNVSRLCRVYDGPMIYVDGVGSRGGINKWLGGLFGFGAKNRVNDALTMVELMHDGNGEPVDIVGWSRGGAMAIHFAHELLERGVVVRFLGLFDPVGQFGLPGKFVNLGWKLTRPPGVIVCQINALDEPSILFPPIRANPSVLWLPGTHGEIGRGPQSLYRMQSAMSQLGIPIERPTARAPRAAYHMRRRFWRRPRPGDLILASNGDYR